MNQTYRFAKPVSTMMTVAAVCFCLLVVTIPVGVYFAVRARKARLQFDDTGFTVVGLGRTTRWEFAELDRIGTLTVEVIGGGPLANINGGAHAVNLFAKTKGGKTLRFMLSRFEAWEEILGRVQAGTNLPIETLRRGVVWGPNWPKRIGA